MPYRFAEAIRGCEKRKSWISGLAFIYKMVYIYRIPGAALSGVRTGVAGVVVFDEEVAFMLNLCGTTTVRELLTTHPEVIEVMLGHGMCEDCRENPPEVPLSHFAMKHCGGDLAGLIEELYGAIEAQVA